jgi:hypothetical protein
VRGNHQVFAAERLTFALLFGSQTEIFERA